MLNKTGYDNFDNVKSNGNRALNSEKVKELLASSNAIILDESINKAKIKDLTGDLLTRYEEIKNERILKVIKITRIGLIYTFA